MFLQSLESRDYDLFPFFWRMKFNLHSTFSRLSRYFGPHFYQSRSVFTFTFLLIWLATVQKKLSLLLPTGIQAKTYEIFCTAKICHQHSILFYRLSQQFLGTFNLTIFFNLARLLKVSVKLKLVRTSFKLEKKKQKVASIM